MPTKQTFWSLQAIDTMKISRDRARDRGMDELIPRITKVVSEQDATHIAIGTPYDEEFYPVLKKWVTSARANNLKVWFRGNFSGWEGWFGYPKFKTLEQHHLLTQQFIHAHPDLFEEGDIFTPVPEPENGVIGDPRVSVDKVTPFLEFLTTSYQSCQESFKQASLFVTCGYFSTNGDVAKQIFTKEFVHNTGGVVVIDHFVSEPKQMAADISYLSEKLGAKIVIGEFGAPIPDINGSMNEHQQAEFISLLLNTIAAAGEKVVGVNYWTLVDGSTSLLTPDFNAKQGLFSLKSYFLPSILSGKLADPGGRAIRDATVSAGGIQSKTNENGEYILKLPAGNYEVKIEKDGFKTITRQVSLPPHEERSADYIIEPDNLSWFLRWFFTLKQLLGF